jgi:nicotinamidase-related amidase
LNRSRTRFTSASICRIFSLEAVYGKRPGWSVFCPPSSPLTALRPERTIFTRFITPEKPDERPGRWRRYFERWRQATRAEARQLDLVPELERFAPPAIVVDKPGYSAFTSAKLYPFLIERQVRTVVLSGTETDVCVLATALGAVDLGFRVVIRQTRVLRDICTVSDEVRYLHTGWWARQGSNL